MSFESYNKKKALALWDELRFSDFPSNTIMERDGELRVYCPALYGLRMSPEHYFGRGRWRDFYADLLRYEADRRPWNTIRPMEEE
jgi:hypothetical protein